MTGTRQASLRLQDGQGNKTGELTLWDDGTVQILPSDALRAKVTKAAEQLDTGVLKWGASLLYGLATVGAALYMHDRRAKGYSFFGAAGLVGVGAREARRIAQRLPDFLDKRVPARDLTAHIEDDGTLALTVRGRGPWATVALRFAPGEYDAVEALAFLNALTAAGETA